MKKSLIFIAILVLLPIVQAATISGNIYDIDLNPAKNTVIKITTIPEQTYVSKDGTYQFTVQEGEYIITASYEKDSNKYLYKKEIKVVEEGSYVLDLILYPEDIQQDIPIEEPHKETNYILYAIIILILITAGVIFYLKKKPKKPIQEDELPKKVIKFIKEQGGRTTQKDIRTRFQSLSEAKISLVITELEHKNQIKKIKKGRGNIIILQ